MDRIPATPFSTEGPVIRLTEMMGVSRTVSGPPAVDVATKPVDAEQQRDEPEPFLVDTTQVDDSRFVTTARPPASHPYFTDHTGPSLIDPLLLLECCRQAETHAAQTQFGVTPDTRSLLQSWSLEAYPLLTSGLSIGPTEVIMSVHTRDAVRRSDSLRAQTYRLQVFVAGLHLADVGMRVKYVPDDVYQAMRRSHDGPIDSDELTPHGPVTVKPGRVARSKPENVVLVDPQLGPDKLWAGLYIPAGPGPFGQVTDHVPELALVEAGRQLAVLAASAFNDVPPANWSLTGIDASFVGHAELDTPLLLVADRPDEGRTDSSFQVTFEQAGETVAEAFYTGGLPA